MGMNEIPWFKWTYNLTLIYALVTIMVLFHKSDFINVSVRFIMLLVDCMCDGYFYAPKYTKNHSVYLQILSSRNIHFYYL